MALQLHRSGSSFRFATGSAGFSRYLEIVVNDDTIQANRDFGVFDLLPVLRFGVGEVDVVGLPTERRKAGIHFGVLDRINAAAFIVRSLQSKGVENLHLEVVDLVKSAVSPTLAAGCRTVGKQELKVHVVVVEFSLRANVGSIGVQQLGFFVQPPALPFVFVRAVKERNGALGRLFAHRGTLSLSFFQDETFVQRNDSIGNVPGVGLVTVGWKLFGRAEGVRRSGKILSVSCGRAQDNLLAFEFSIQQAPVFAVPSRSRQPAGKKNDLKGSFVESDNLGSHSASGIFALIGEVSWNIGIVGIDESAWEILLGRGAMEGKGEEGEKA